MCINQSIYTYESYWKDLGKPTRGSKINSDYYQILGVKSSCKLSTSSGKKKKHTRNANIIIIRPYKNRKQDNNTWLPYEDEKYLHMQTHLKDNPIQVRYTDANRMLHQSTSWHRCGRFGNKNSKPYSNFMRALK